MLELHRLATFYESFIEYPKKIIGVQVSPTGIYNIPEA